MMFGSNGVAPDTEAAASADPVERMLADARRQLVETGTRNRLVHVNLQNKRAKAVGIVNERSDDVYDLLRTKNRRMRFKATGRDPKEGDDGPAVAALDLFDEPFDERRYTDEFLETDLGPETQAKKLLAIARDARTVEEEQGVNVLYLALGFLVWFEDRSSAVERTAPLVLVPVELVRDPRTSTYDLRARDEDIVTNMPLAQRLRGDFGIDLPEIDTGEEDWRPCAYFDAVREAIRPKEAWRVEPDAMQLGFFSFAKFLMLRDLDPANWPGEGLDGSEIVDTLLAGNFRSEPPLFGRDEPLDPRLSPADLIHVVDADASQTKVIEEVRAGRNLVVQGPPGTGKSQTITNIIASAVHDGRSVLFVAEKMAALSVVHERLKRCGLESVCLELHSRAANKKTVLEELKRTMAAGANPPPEPGDPEELLRLRDLLNRHSDLLHAPVDGLGLTPHGALARLVRLMGRQVPAPQLEDDALGAVDRAGLAELERDVTRYAEARERLGDPRVHPFRNVTDLDLQPTDLVRLKSEAEGAASAADALREAAAALAAWLDMAAQSAADIARIADLLKAVAAAPSGMSGLLATIDAADRTRLSTALLAATAWLEQRNASDFVAAAWTSDAASLRSGLARGVGSFFARFGSRYRSASRELATLIEGPLPRKAPDRLAFADRLLAAQAAKAAYEGERPFLVATLGDMWREEATPFARIAEVARWYETLRRDGFALDAARLAKLASEPRQLAGPIETLRSADSDWRAKDGRVVARVGLDREARFGTAEPSRIALEELAASYRAMADDIASYDEWVARERARQNLDRSLAPLRERMDDGSPDEGGLDAAGALDELRYAHAEAVWRRALQRRPELHGLAGTDRHALVAAFARTGRARMRDVQRLVAARHLRSLPGGEFGEMGVIRSEIARRRRHKPVRKLIEQAGTAMQRLKPVFLMSPISLAQFVPPDTLRFDLLVIDEASQVRPADALGAVARCGQIVVVGDRKQLPPTAFFDRMTSNDGEDDEADDVLGGAAKATELESILTLCEARNLRSQMLEWHYRSRDPSLISVSNAEFYGSNLVLPPSPTQEDDATGLRFVSVQGAYTSQGKGTGRPGTNKIEAEALAAAVADHARLNPDQSLGIVAFSTRQRDMITEVLEAARRADPVLDAFLREGRHEDVFVKNIENVQGDERDVILISVGYGPIEPGGRLLSMSFGPINGDGGERRLNVLFSRARIRCDVFCSFDPGDIDLSRTKSDGVRVFKRFLDYAKTGELTEALPTGALADSPFEEDVADTVRRLGYAVDHQVGSAGFRIDLAVRHPERPGSYMLAVECDGATYHSALWARERDRLRQDVLEHGGWTFHRIWSTDWFHRRESEVDRLRTALEDATAAHRDGIAMDGANAGFAVEVAEDAWDDEPSPDEIVLPEPVAFTVPYEMADFTVTSSLEPHEASPSQVGKAVRRIVEIEGPVHEEEIARRLAAAFNKERAGARIADVTRRALAGLARANDPDRLQHDGPFWFTANRSVDVPMRSRAGLQGGLAKADMLPPMEIRAVADRVVSENGALEHDELVRAVARAFGFERVGSSLREAIGAAVG